MDRCICRLMPRLPKESKQFCQCTRFKKNTLFSAWWNYDVLIDGLFGNKLLSRVEIISIQSIQDKGYIPSKESNQTVTPLINLTKKDVRIMWRTCWRWNLDWNTTFTSFDVCLFHASVLINRFFERCHQNSVASKHICPAPFQILANIGLERWWRSCCLTNVEKTHVFLNKHL